MTPALEVYLWSVVEYHRLIELGILTKDSRVELLEGLLVTRMRMSPTRRYSIHVGRVVLERILPVGWYVGEHHPVTTADSEPEPDLSIVRGDIRDYLDHHPGSRDTALIVEVSDSALERDRTLMKRIYAAAGILVYWIVNLPERQVEVYSDPTGPDAKPDYRQRTDYAETGDVPLILDGREVGKIAVRELLP